MVRGSGRSVKLGDLSRTSLGSGMTRGVEEDFYSQLPVSREDRAARDAEIAYADVCRQHELLRQELSDVQSLLGGVDVWAVDQLCRYARELEGVTADISSLVSQLRNSLGARERRDERAVRGYLKHHG